MQITWQMEINEKIGLFKLYKNYARLGQRNKYKNYKPVFKP